MRIPSLFLLLATLCLSSFANQGEPPEALKRLALREAGASKTRVYFKNLKDGATLPAKDAKLRFAVEGMKIRPAGEVVEGTGHHHLIIDGGPVVEGQPIVADAKHIHFGKGQEETVISLTPGPHTLTLQFANGAHLSYGPVMSSTIHVLVK